ncbi:LOB domain-containing protein 37 [Phoenix dactylifera]|uniref:LOB domain-containing protein 37 n=1 Tax=Phoenix dactylifera TaxID=42345 RepID=A0A8B7BX54_PHODC|nr:LOB domain-containing protein 37 [Phoenix dactylifera]
MSCNGCRVLRKGCSEACILRPCLQWIDSPEAQGHATVFVAKFFGRAGLMSFISAVPESQRPALFQSLLFEACGRTINPVNGAVGLLGGGNWHLCQVAVETVLRGGTLKPLPELAAAADHDDVAAVVGGKGGFLYGRLRAGGWPLSSAAKRPKASPAENNAAAPPCDLDLCLTPGSPAVVREQKRRRPATPSMTSEGSVTTSGESGGDRQPQLLNLFV